MKTVKRPMYQLIVDDVKRKILNGEISTEEPIPSQIELAKLYETSEITSRRALTELAQEGLIYRVRGKGSYVSRAYAEASGAEARIETIYLIYHALPVEQFNHGFFADLLRGLHEKCEENRVQFQLWDIGEREKLPPNSERSGLVLLPGAMETDFVSADIVAGWKSEGRKIVTVHFYFPHLQIPYVIVDNMTGGYLATQHLLSIGHRRIGIVLTGSSVAGLNQEFSLRFQGYKLALSQYKIEFDPTLVVVIEGTMEQADSGAQGFDRLMDLDAPPTAIFLTSDIKAFGAMKAAERRGIAIPGDVSVVGYDDLFVSSYVRPSLSSVNQNTYRVGKRAVELLLEGEAASGKTFSKDEIEPSLIVRDSTAEWNGDE
ncbi:GntR family transcriptional regulator [Cohnella rhizosphaerae]|uniref:GntR family transcriptional regulator n=1 Tax=Cohnella rhizosphaerae TaxID=1457232 RepID=A0A9X4QU02_9BACL|nr:GntR family transcriptional regulator [Cohnella rhizosphaerae]MDG0810959.1 GntR family transcriptional regulator [Cohnella rhizosphaerae]